MSPNRFGSPIPANLKTLKSTAVTFLLMGRVSLLLLEVCPHRDDMLLLHNAPFPESRTNNCADGYVRIWSTEAILQSNNPDYAKPKQLAAISHHSGTIHAVRFSSSGKYLASGADDKIVCVYALDPNAASHVTFGGIRSRLHAMRQLLMVNRFQ